jgi:hypothetical protein
MGSSISKSRAAFAALLLLVVSGCTPTNKAVGRYHSAICETEGSPQDSCNSVIPTASAYAVSIETQPGEPPASGTGFPERALAAYIVALSNPKMSPTAQDLRANLTASLAPASSTSAAEVRTVFHRTIIVTVRKDGGFNPADRLEATNVKITPDKARFDSWDTLATAYTTINAGTIQLTQARGTTENITAGSPSSAPVSITGSLSATQTNTRTENFTASIQAETLSATVEDDGRALVIHRQGGPDIDLTGNTVIKVDMSYSENPMSTYIFAVAKYVDVKSKWLPPQKVALVAKPVSAVPPGTAIKADVELTYTIRHVRTGDGTFEERDDDVLEKTSGPVIKHVTLIPAREASPPGFGLFSTLGSYKDFAVNAARPGRAPVGLCFDSYNEASDFLAYMKAANGRTPDHVGDNKLGFLVPPDQELTAPLTSSQLAGLEVRAKCF